MTITSDAIKKAFAPITSITKSEPVQVDLEDVATNLITKTADFANAENPLAVLDDLESVVNKVDHMLEHATMGDDGKVLVTGSLEACETAKSMHGMGKPKKSKMVEDEEKKTADKADAAPETETAKTEETTEETTTTEEASTETAKTADDSEDLSDKIDWENDLSPSVPPISKAARLTKDERVIRAQKGARQHESVTKSVEARDKALSRRDERASGGRTLS